MQAKTRQAANDTSGIEQFVSQFSGLQPTLVMLLAKLPKLGKLGRPHLAAVVGVAPLNGGFEVATG